MWREKRNLQQIIANEDVKLATDEEAGRFKFYYRAHPAKKDPQKLLGKDKTLRKVYDIFKDNPDATVLVRNTEWARVPKLRTNLATLLGVPQIQSAEAVFSRDERTDPFTIVLRIEKPKPDKPKKEKVIKEIVVRKW